MKTIRARKGGAQMSQTPYAQAHSYDYKHCEEGKIYHVVQEFGRANGLVQIRLSHDAGIRWIKEDEWEVISSGASRSEDAAREGKLLNLPEIPSEGPPQRSIQIAEQTPLCPHETLQWASGRPQAVPYYSQRDNKVDPNTTCFSSAVAMVLAAAFPHAISDDEDYINFRVKHGLSTTAQSHLDCLRKDFLVDARFSNRQSLDWLKDRAEKGLATAVGLLHRGRLDNPTKNGGHYVVVFGRVGDDNWLVHDPYGKYNWENGTHTNESGANLVWPHEVLYHRATPAARDGHLNDLWALWIESD